MLTSKIQNILIGTVPASKMMYKGMQLWPRLETLDVDYLCFESDGVSSIQFNKDYYSTFQQYLPKFQYSYDCTIWNDFVFSFNSDSYAYETQPVYFHVNKPLYVRGLNPDGFLNTKELSVNNPPKTRTKLSGDSVYCKGKLSSIINYSAKTTTIPHNKCFWEFFRDCEVLKSAPELDFTVLTDFCYYGMFRETGLEVAPELPAQYMKTRCYDSMFYGCENLTSCPELSEWLADGCYRYMFAYTGISECPSLPSVYLPTECYAYMFHNCLNIKTAPELPATEIGIRSYYGMFSYSRIQTLPSIEHVTKINTGGCMGMFLACNNIKQSGVESFIIKAELSNSACETMFEHASITRAALQSKKLYDSCYAAMFYNSDISVVTMLATEADEKAWSTDSLNYYHPFRDKRVNLTGTTDYVYIGWLDDVPPGHVVLNNNKPADWTFSKLAIPSNWNHSTVTF